jgi:hypothetical protein
MQNGCQPSDFWQMTPSEPYVFLESKKQERYYSGMQESDVEELLEMRKNGDFI